MRKTLCFLFFALTTAFIVSCESDDDESLTRRQIISKTWTVSEAELGRETAEDTLYQNYSITFTENGTYSVVNPDSLHSPNHIDSSEGLWELSLNENQIILDAGSDYEEFVQLVYVGLDGKRMEWEWVVEFPDTTDIKYEFGLVPAE